VICLQELTLLPYIAVAPDDEATAREMVEDPETGPTATFARELPTETGAVLHASLYQRDALLSMGCHFGQGYYYSMPLEAEDFRWLLHQLVRLSLSKPDLGPFIGSCYRAMRIKFR